MLIRKKLTAAEVFTESFRRHCGTFHLMPAPSEVILIIKGAVSR
jgi:hypothetical protein